VVALLSQETARVNEDLPKAAQVRAFGLFEKELDADDDELTRTNKVRRSTILRKYRDMIDSLYAGVEPAADGGRR
jgi:long-chain acyl-CoA synthetase